ncbi:MmpS family transport accessory protein [Nocardia brasiliensis]|nr:MmpS family transport accessory protein [Nocardia brasiliensis]
MTNPQYRPPRLPTWLWVLLVVVTLVAGGGVVAAAVVADKNTSGTATPAPTTPRTHRPTPPQTRRPTPPQAGRPTPPPAGPRTEHRATPKMVRYEVLSSTGMVPRLHYIDDAGPHTEIKAPSPWSKEVVTSQKDVLLTLTAQGDDDADLTCRITVDGSVRTERSAQGPQANAICTLD